MKNICFILFLSLLSHCISAQNDSINFNLLEAAYDNNQSALIQALKDSADVNFKDYEGNTALIYASQKGNIDIVKILLYNGADSKEKNTNGFTPLHEAAKFSHNIVCNELLMNGADVEAQASFFEIKAIHFAAAYNNLELVDMLLFYKAEVNAITKYGVTALHLASHAGYYQIDSILLVNGADINIRDEDKNTALILATQNNQIHIVRYLIDSGALIDVENKDNNNAIYFALDQKNIDIIDTLVYAYKKRNIQARNANELAYKAEILHIPSIKKSISPIIKGTRIFPLISANVWGMNFDWNPTDMIPSVFWGLHEEHFNIDMTIGYGRRLWRNRILYNTDDDETTLYQYRENRSKFYVELYKKIPFIELNKGHFGCYLGVKESFTYGNFKGTYEKPKTEFLFSPVGGFYVDKRNFRQRIGYSYIKHTNNHSTLPHVITYSMYFYGYFDRFSSKEVNYKTIYWL
jgi:ankyrin repeat protein